MKLPTIENPKYVLSLPSTGEPIEYRPFLVKEEKILLIAQESNDPNTIFKAITDVIENCTEGSLKGKKLTSFDVEYIFIKLRAKSVGEIAKIGLSCSECEKVNYVDVDLESIEIIKEQELPNKIMLTDKVGVVPRYISAEDMKKLSSITDNTELYYKTLIASIESVFDAENVYPVEEVSKSELESFVESLSRAQIAKFENILENTPKLQKDIQYTCEDCGSANTHTLQGIQSFFE